jgi:predicted DNA-binding protein (MmcQ/YjbR family)
MTHDPFHDRLLAMVLQLPGATEEWPWGSIHCKVDGKIFVGWGRHEDGTMSIGIRLSLLRQSEMVGTDPRFSVAKYVGKYGGVDVKLGPKPDWREVESLIVESYRNIASKKRVKELDALGATPTATAAKGRATKQPATTKTKAPPASKPKARAPGVARATSKARKPS